MITFDAIRLIGLKTIDLPIFGVKPSDPYQVSMVDGLGPPELSVLLAENHTSNGIFISRRAQGRQITIRIGLNPDYKIGQTVSDLRYALYGLLSPRVDPGNQSMTLQLLLNNVPVLQTVGYISRIEIVPFAKKPEVQLVIDCLTPYLEEPQLRNSGAQASSSWPILNEGLAPTGIYFELVFVKKVPSFSIAIFGGDSMKFYSNFEIDDVLVVDTNKNQRFVGQKRGTQYIKNLEILSSDSTWITLNGGNHIVLTSPVNEYNWIWFRHRVRHWGI